MNLTYIFASIAVLFLTIFIVILPMLVYRFAKDQHRSSLSLSIINQSLSAAAALLLRQPTKINLSDPSTIKHALDDHSASYFVEAGYEEDVSYSNYRLISSGISVLLALSAQFYPVPFPDNINYLYYAVIIYFILQIITHGSLWFYETDSILLTKPREKIIINNNNNNKGGEDNKKKQKSSSSSSSLLNLPKHLSISGLCIRSEYTRYKTHYRLIISYRKKGGYRAAIKPKAFDEKTVNEYFDKKRIEFDTISKADAASNQQHPSQSFSSDHDPIPIDPDTLIEPFQKYQSLGYCSIKDSSSEELVVVDRILSITDYFDENGYLLPIRLYSQLNALYHDFIEAAQKAEKSQ